MSREDQKRVSLDMASISAGNGAQVLVEQQGHTNRCSRCSITSGVIGGISIT